MPAMIKLSVASLIAMLALPPGPPESRQPPGFAAAPPDAITAASLLEIAPDAVPPSDASAIPAPAENAAAASRASVSVDVPLSGAPPIAIGDKLRIGFFESIDAGPDPKSGHNGAEPPLRAFFQRADLGGEYAVEQDGGVSIPILGRFAVQGRKLDDVREEMAKAFVAVMGREASVDLKVTEHSPVYVVGMVKTPGAYRYAPGMIVLQAVALAGGLRRGDDDPAMLIEGARETERLRRETLVVEGLLARRARLEAERDALVSVSASDQPPYFSLAVQQDGPVTTDRQARAAARLSEAESAILRADLARRRQAERDIALHVAAARSQVEALRRKLDQFDVQRDLRRERLDAMVKLKDRGVETSNTVLVLRTELADIEAHRQDALATAGESEARLAQAEEEASRSATEFRDNLAREIASVDGELAEARAATHSAGRLAALLSPAAGSSAQASRYQIVRQSPGAARTFGAAETSVLVPGDVLKVMGRDPDVRGGERDD